MSLEKQCKTCFKVYKNNSAYNTHTMLCSFLSQEDVSQCEDVPTFKELCGIVQMMCVKMKNQELEIKKLRLQMAKTKKQEIKFICEDYIINLTNTQTPMMTFEFFKSKLYEYICENDILELENDVSLIQIIINIFNNFLDFCKKDKPPIHKNDDIIYIYVDGWKIMPDDELIFILKNINRQLTKKLIEYYEKNRNNLQNDELNAEKYMNSLKSISKFNYTSKIITTIKNGLSQS